MAPPAAPTAAPTTAPTAASFTTSAVLSRSPVCEAAYRLQASTAACGGIVDGWATRRARRASADGGPRVVAHPVGDDEPGHERRRHHQRHRDRSDLPRIPAPVHHLPPPRPPNPAQRERSPLEPHAWPRPGSLELSVLP